MIYKKPAKVFEYINLTSAGSPNFLIFSFVSSVYEHNNALSTFLDRYEFPMKSKCTAHICMLSRHRAHGGTRRDADRMSCPRILFQNRFPYICVYAICFGI